jgi:hypothetical protein
LSSVLPVAVSVLQLLLDQSMPAAEPGAGHQGAGQAIEAGQRLQLGELERCRIVAGHCAGRGIGRDRE